MTIIEPLDGMCMCETAIRVPDHVRASRPVTCVCGRCYWYEPKHECYFMRARPVVFLDIDGVLLTTKNRSTPAQPSVRALNYLTDNTGAIIVVSSSWRKGGLDYVRSRLGPWGVDGDIMSCTADDDKPRGEQVNDWLIRHRAQKRAFVILDDELYDFGKLHRHVIPTEMQIGLTAIAARIAARQLIFAAKRDPLSRPDRAGYLVRIGRKRPIG